MFKREPSTLSSRKGRDAPCGGGSDPDLSIFVLLRPPAHTCLLLLLLLSTPIHPGLGLRTPKQEHLSSLSFCDHSPLCASLFPAMCGFLHTLLFSPDDLNTSYPSGHHLNISLHLTHFPWEHLYSEICVTNSNFYPDV